MKRILPITTALLLVLSCTSRIRPAQHEVSIRAGFVPATRLHLEGADAPLTANRKWVWNEEDFLLLGYSDDGSAQTCRSSSVKLDPDDRQYAVFTFIIPSTARATSLEYGTPAAFGKTCDASMDIPDEMVFAQASLSGEPGETNLPAGLLQHRCSYLLIDPSVPEKDVRSIIISGTGLRGETKGEETLAFPTEGAVPFRVALCNEAEDVVIEAIDSAGQKTEMAHLDDLGDGICQMYEINYKTIINYRK